MALKKAKKIEVVVTLEKAIKGAKSFVFVNFHGLNVAGVSELRKKLRAHGIGYTVSKKTLLKRALDTAKFEGEMPVLDGEVALVYGEDALAPAREVYGFHKEHRDVLKIIGGIFEGKYLDAAKMLSIATIPSREVLIAQFVNLINSPIARFAVVLNQIAEKKGTAAPVETPAPAAAPVTS